VLADATMRSRYDSHGAASLDGNQWMDAGVFFTMLFGSERFEPYIGKLALASAASMDGTISMRRLSIKQQKREVGLALHLCELCQNSIDGGADGQEAFEANIRAEAKDLVNVSFGECLLYVVAELYACRADEYVGAKESVLGVDGHLAAFKTTRVSWQNHAAAAGAGIRAAGAAIRTFNTVRELADQQRQQGEGATPSGQDPLGSLTPDQLKATQENLPIFLEAIWHVSVVDIERTLTAVTHKLCRDHAVDEMRRLQRAHVLKQIAAIFMEEALAKGGSKDPTKKVTDMVQMIAPQFAGATEAASGSTSGGGGSGAAANGTPSPSGPPEPPKVYSIDELRTLPVRELKALLRSHGVSEVEVVEKEELVQVIYALQQSAIKPEVSSCL